MKTLKVLSIVAILIHMTSNIYSQEDIPAELLFKDNEYSMYRLSPEGNYFMCLLKHNIGYEIIVVDIESFFIYKYIPIGKKRANELTWIDSRRILYEVKGELYTINIDGTDNKLLMGIWKDDTPEILTEDSYKKYYQRNRLLNNLWNEKDYIIVESKNWKGYAYLYKVDLFTGKKELIEDGNKLKVNSWIVNRRGRPILGLRYTKDDKIDILKKKSSGNWEKSNISIGDSIYQLTIEGKSYFNNPLKFNGVGFNNSIYLGSKISSDKRKLIKYSFDNNEVTTILKNEEYDIGDYTSNQSELVFNDSKNQLLAVKYHSDKPNIFWFDTTYVSLQNSLNKKYPDLYHEVIDVNFDASVLLLYLWHPKLAGRIGIVKKDSAKIAPLLALNKDLEKYNLSNTSIINIPTRDKVNLLGYLNLPKDSKYDKIPLVVIPHGGPWARDYYYFEPISQFFASRGYAALRINFRGSIGFGEKFFMAGIKNIHSVMLDDIFDGAKYCVDNYSLDASNVFIYGHSYGGYASVMSAIKYPEFYKSVVSVSAPYDIQDWMKLQKKNDNKFSLELWEYAIGHHSNDKEFIKAISPINNVEKLKTPILMFHGEIDNVIPCEQARDFEKIMKKYEIEYELKILQKEGHNLKDGNNSGYILKRSDKFFQDQILN